VGHCYATSWNLWGTLQKHYIHCCTVIDHDVNITTNSDIHRGIILHQSRTMVALGAYILPMLRLTQLISYALPSSSSCPWRPMSFRSPSRASLRTPRLSPPLCPIPCLFLITDSLLPFFPSFSFVSFLGSWAVYSTNAKASHPSMAFGTHQKKAPVGCTPYGPPPPTPMVPTR